jgi:hypothetical protein
VNGRGRADRGAVSVFVVLLMVVVVAAAGLVYDGGRLLAVRRQAINHAEGAARAGADAGAVVAGGGFDAPAAIAGALAYLDALGVDGAEVHVEGVSTVVVTVRSTRSPVLLSLFGVGEQQVVGRGAASPEFVA